MAELPEFFSPDEIRSEEAVTCWDAAAEEFAAHFADGGDFYHRHFIIPAVLALIGEFRGRRVLDLACGEGHLARLLADRAGGRVDVTAVDASEGMLRIARRETTAHPEAVRFLRADASDLHELPADSFDLAVCNMGLLDIKDYAGAIAEVARVLKPRSLFVFSILHPCFWTPGCGWIKADPERTDPDNKMGWRVDHYHDRLVVRFPVKRKMSRTTYYFHRTLGDYVAALRGAGFVVTDLREPVPSPEAVRRDPGQGPDRKLSTFLVVQCRLLPEALDATGGP
jgi:ubiquinone/menaquinone biosynthesis C-methylase UbiE